MQIVNGADVLHRPIAQIIGGTIHQSNRARPHQPATSTSIGCDDRDQPALCWIGTSAFDRFAGPHDQGIIQHVFGFEVLDERRAGLVHFFRPQRQLFLQQTMMIPIAMIELYETRTPRSANRRANKQFEANEPSPGVQPYISIVRASSVRVSINSGTLACIS